ncbi:zinc finger protein 37A, partial [Biomphalaria glabrata]
CPMSRKQAILQRQSLEKYQNVSDGESDSGSSTSAEARHEMAPELEYSWECPSGLSLLLELMTQSPQRLSSRDIVEVGSEVKATEKHRSRSDMECASIDGMRERYGVYSRQGEVSEMNTPLANHEKYVSAGERQYAHFEDNVDRRSSFNYSPYPPHCEQQNSPTQVPSESTAYEYEEHEHGQKFYLAQRKISFDAGRYDNGKPVVQRPNSPIEEPIDYSQLSSRRREVKVEMPHTKQEPQDLSLRSPDEDCNRRYGIVTSRLTEKAPPVLVPKYEFILSPKMDNNGNLILTQPQSNTKSALIGQDYLKRKASDAVQGACAAKYSYDLKHETVAPQRSPTTKSTSEHKYETFPVSKHSNVSQNSPYAEEKTEVPYHPKLKYLVAATQYAKAKAKQEEEAELEAKQKSCSQPSVLFSQDRSLQEEMSAEVPEEERMTLVSPQSVPTSDYFQHNSIHSTNVFILNTGSSIIASEVPRGSIMSQQQSQIIEIHPHLTPSSAIHISGQVIGSSDILVQEQYPNDLEPPSPDDQPLSPASLREQQSTLSELLFSSSRKAGVDPYACADCGKRYSTSSNLARHRQTHRSVCDKKARKCPHCEKVYVSMPAYSMHVRTHNQGCECPHCGKKFSRPWLLQGHIRTHTGEKPFGCHQCGKSFADKSNLRAHIQTHSTDKPYVCGRCGKAFALKSYLYKHEESSCMRGQRFRN